LFHLEAKVEDWGATLKFCAWLKSPVLLHRFELYKFVPLERWGFWAVPGLVGEGDGDAGGTGDTLLELGESECNEPVDW